MIMSKLKMCNRASPSIGATMDLKETCLETALVYEGNFIRVHKDNVLLPDGAVSSREYINHPGAVAVLAILDNGNLVMERQFRYAPQREFIELPAGKIDHGEDILLTACLLYTSDAADD